MALTFGGATTDRVSVSAATSINNISSGTFCTWVRVTTFTGGRAFHGKNTQKHFRLNGTGGNVEATFTRSGGSANYITNNQALSTNTWTFLAWSFTPSTPAIHIYKGLQTAVATEFTYGTASDQTGGATADSAGGLEYGNRTGVSVSLQGQIASIQYFNRVLSIDEIISQQFRPRMVSGCVLLHFPGFAGTGTQPDWSGNANSGSVSGATLSTTTGLPVGPPFVHNVWRKRGPVTAVSHISYLPMLGVG